MKPEDRVKTLNKRLKKVVEKFNELKKSGIDEEILIVYIHHKTKLSRKNVKKMLEAQEEFYKKLIGKLMLDAL